MKRDETIARIIDRARRSGYVISRRQALDLGAHSSLLADLVRSGVLLRLQPGVYALAGVPNDHRLAIRAALCALGALGEDGACASHTSAAWLQGLIDSPPSLVHLTAGPERRRLDRAVVHRSMREALPRRSFRGLPCTLPPRTLVDLAATATPAALDDAVDRALAKGLVRSRDMIAETQSKGRRGTDQLRRSLARRGGVGAPTPSVLESRMARLLVRYGLPTPKAEVAAGRDGEYHLDYSFVAQRLVVELYGYAWHHSPRQMTHDLERQRRLTLAGWTILVFTWQDVTGEPGRVAGEIRAALSNKSGPSDRTDRASKPA